MDFEELLVKNRSYRRFKETERISRQTLLELVNCARRAPSGGNRQPLKYALVHDALECARIFPHLRWAGLLREWGGPAEGERPAAYIAILADPELAKTPDCDVGIAGQTLMLAATARGLGSCLLGSIDRLKIQEELNLPKQYTMPLILALGVPAEKCVLEDAPAGGSVAYYRDAQDVHHVPKRPLDEVIVR